MTKEQIRDIVSQNQLDNIRSRNVKVVMSGGAMIIGKFFGVMQFTLNLKSNKWLISFDGMDILLYGDEISTIVNI